MAVAKHYGGWLSRAALRAGVLARLKGLAFLLNHRKIYRDQLTARHPRGDELDFAGSFQFELAENGSPGFCVHARCGGGRMSVGAGPLADPEVVVRFHDPEAMRSFFQGGDTFSFLLENRLSLRGHFGKLLKFGHMSRVVLQRARPLQPERPWAETHGPASWRELAVPRPGQAAPAAAGEPLHLDDPHLAAYTLDDFPRIKKLLWLFRTTQPEICSERPRLLTEFKLTHRAGPRAGEPAVLRQGRAIAHILNGHRAIVWPEDLLAGTTTAKRIGVVIYPETGGLGIWPELLTVAARELNPYRLAAEDRRVLDQEVFPFWLDDNIRDWAKQHAGDARVLELDEKFVLYFMWKTQAVSHTVADLPRVLEQGLAAIGAEAARRREREPDPEKQAFYRAVELSLAGVCNYAARLERECRRQLESCPEPERRERLQAMAESLARVPAHPARTLREALQATWIVFLSQHLENMNAGLSLGRLDTWLQPYLERDLAAASSAEQMRRVLEQALELTCAFMLKLTDHLPLVPDLGNRLFGGSSSDQVITLGGVKPDGSSAVCDMTYIFLKATEMLRLRDPNMNARYCPGVNSRTYLERLCEVNLLTRASPSLHNDAAMVPALERQGFPTEHARDWSATGCVEPTICGRHFGHTNSMMFNLVAPLEMALHDGRHPLVGEQLGPATGPVTACRDFESLFAIYREQLGWLIDRSVEANNLLGHAHQVLKPTPLLSALFRGPLDKGRDLTAGGAEYNSSGVALIGLCDVVDSLAAVQVAVFEQGYCSLERLLEALANDFADDAKLHAYLLKRAPKFGGSHPLPGQLAARVVDFCFARFQAHRNYRGGRYLPGYWSMSNHVAFGVLSGALPSGRRRGQPFTPGLTPGAYCGAALTEQIRAVAALETEKFPNNVAFNVKVTPAAGDRHRQVVERLASYVQAYFELGGMQMQFNVVDTDTLRRARLAPEQYRDLLVRISGYNAYFVELNPDIQDEIISRMEHQLG